MATVYKSKTDAWLVAVFALAMAVSLSASATVLLAGESAIWWVIVFTVALGIGLPLWVLLGTDYRLESGQLHVRSGPFKWRIPVAAITNIVPTSNPLSSPALSLDRLRIEYEHGKTIMISPRDRDRFLRDMEAMRRVAS